jgi:hypothetical protein
MQQEVLVVIIPFQEVDHELQQHLASAQTNAVVVCMGGNLGQGVDGNFPLGVVKS